MADNLAVNNFTNTTKVGSKLNAPTTGQTGTIPNEPIDMAKVLKQRREITDKTMLERYYADLSPRDLANMQEVQESEAYRVKHGNTLNWIRKLINGFGNFVAAK